MTENEFKEIYNNLNQENKNNLTSYLADLKENAHNQTLAVAYPQGVV